MTVLDTTVHCHECKKPMQYNLVVLIDVTLEGRLNGFDHTCIYCHECGLKIEEEEDE